MTTWLQDLTADQVFQWLLIAGLVIWALQWGAVHVRPLMKKLDDMLEDFNGEKPRPGVEARPGVLERLAVLERDTSFLKMELNRLSSLMDKIAEKIGVKDEPNPS